jgi:uncharacterized protein
VSAVQSNPFSLEGRQILVTGASSGIGESYARHLARTGHDLAIVARREERLRTLAAELEQAHGADVEVIVADLGSPAGLARVAERVETGEPLSMLVNNAGYASRGPVAMLDVPALEAMLRVNVLALSCLSHAALARMMADGAGTIINIGSGTMFMQLPGNAGYGSSKAYVAHFTRHMQLEAAGSGVRIQLLIPGVIRTSFHSVAGNDIANFAPERVMGADDLVVASLRALEMGELVCLPSLPDVTDWDGYVAAERQVMLGVSRDRVADRYHSHSPAAPVPDDAA